MRTPYDWTEDVKKLKGPVMLVYGDADMVRPEHIVAEKQARSSMGLTLGYWYSTIIQSQVYVNQRSPDTEW